MSTEFPQFFPAGDSAILVRFGDTLSLETNRRVLAFDRVLRAESIQAVIEIVPTICSILVSFDPLDINYQRMEHSLRELLLKLPRDHSMPFTRWRIPACYGGKHGPDLFALAQLLGCSEEEAIAQHSAETLSVLMLGFAPGFCYLGLLPESWDIPRLQEVKPMVPAGSISIAVRQTVMTSTADPTGWRTIARTPFRNFALSREQTVLIKPGDEVVYEPVECADFSRLTALVEQGRNVVEFESVA